MNSARRILAATLLALCLGAGPLAAQQPAPGGETAQDFRDKALHEESARPSGAFGLDHNHKPADTWLSGGEKTVKLVAGAVVVLLILRWLWKRRSVNYA